MSGLGLVLHSTIVTVEAVESVTTELAGVTLSRVVVSVVVDEVCLAMAKVRATVELLGVVREQPEPICPALSSLAIQPMLEQRGLA